MAQPDAQSGAVPDPNTVVQLAKGFFQRNNPVEMVMSSVAQTVHTVTTYNSRVKLMKYRFLLAQEQMKSMEGNLNEVNMNQVQGNKFNRIY